MVVGVDPGPSHSAICVVCPDYSIQSAVKVPNDEAEVILRALLDRETELVLEGIQSYGMPVGRETFETCYWIGEFRAIAKGAAAPWTIYPRQEYVTAVCGCRGSDSILRQALLMRFGGYKGTEPLNALKGTDLRSAFAVAVYHLDKERLANGPTKKYPR